MTDMFQNATLLITGGTGSFGNAVLKRFLDFKLKEIRIFSRDEKKQDDMRHQIKSAKVKYFIGDVRDPESLDAPTQGADFIFHAAALKQVPSCEFYPIEAVKTNVLGTNNMLNAAVKHGVKKVVVLSTDKAVYPVNAMGMSKAMMEKVMVANSRSIDPARTLMCGTRYGNVMASRGSVIPLFIEQILARKPMTVTDPEMTRFMMSLDNAVDLVMFAFANALQGDLFVQKAPAATIGDIALALQRIFKSNGEIKVIGTRHGEKKHETLLNREELVRAEDLGAYYRVGADARELNYDRFFSEGDKNVTAQDNYSSDNTQRLSLDAVTKLLADLEEVKAAIRK